MKIDQKIAYDHANSVILTYLRSHIKPGDTILDVGCYRGALGNALRGSGCVIDGIEKDMAAAKKAKTCGYRKVFIWDINTIKPQDLKGMYDYVVLGDVLEHMIDPDNFLVLLKKNLTKGGAIAVSLPNIGFFLFRFLHLFGIWEYEDTGIMDRTHLRFFTLSSMKNFFERNGFSIIFYQSLNTVQKKFFFLEYLLPFFPGLFAIQCVFVVKPKNI